MSGRAIERATPRRLRGRASVSRRRPYAEAWIGPCNPRRSRMNIRTLPIGVSPFDQTRAMSSSGAHPTEDAGYWSWQMAAVSERRDRDSFMRIYDHFAPRVRLYLRGLGSTESQAEELAQEALLRLWQRAD